jgi:malonyl-CoA O-methyltransferase
MLDKARARAAFERAAATYDQAAVLQREVAGRLVERLDLIRLQPTRIVDVGCGTGYCTRALAQRYRGAEVVGIDIAHAMLRRAHGAGSWWQRVRGGRTRYACGDAESLPLPDAVADMIISNLMLQWCDPARVFAEFRRVLRPGGVLMFTSFGPDTLTELRAAWRAADTGIHVHAFLDMHDVGDALLRAGLAEPVMDVERLTLTYADAIEVMRDLKHIGAHNTALGRARGLTGKRHLARVREAYAARARDGRVPATFEVVYGHAWAPPQAAPARDAGVVPLASIGRGRRP